MNQGKIWLVVNPSIGLPAFLGGVALISLAVHSAVLNKTEWYPAFYSGHAKAKAASVETTTPVAKAVAAPEVVVAAADTTTTLVAANAPPAKLK